MISGFSNYMQKLQQLPEGLAPWTPERGFALAPNWGPPPTTNALAALMDFVANFAPSQNHPRSSNTQ